MDVKLSLDGLLSDDQVGQIKQHLAGLAKDQLAAFCRAAIADFAEATVGRRHESSLAIEHRLHKLVKHALEGRIPSETVVGRLFGITERRAMAAISNVSKRYTDDFESGWASAAREAFKGKVDGKDGDHDAYEFSAPQIVIEHLKEVVAGLEGGKLAQIRKVPGTAERYSIRIDTHDKVCAKLGIDGPGAAK